MTKSSRRILVRGRVQGVGFRDWTRAEAEGRGLSGWCRNLGDGSVEVLVAGDEAAVNAFLLVLNEGPRAAEVHALKVEAVDDPQVEGFEIRRTS